MRVVLCVVAVLSGTAISHAEPRYRAVGASARYLACGTSEVIDCSGASSIRTGANVLDLRWARRDGSGPLVTVHAAAAPAHARVATQVFLGAAWRVRRGRAWLQAGPGLMLAEVAERTIPTSRLFDPRTKLALIGGAGFDFEIGARTFEVAIDAGRAIEDERTYQVTTSLATRGF